MYYKSNNARIVGTYVSDNATIWKGQRNLELRTRLESSLFSWKSQQRESLLTIDTSASWQWVALCTSSYQKCSGLVKQPWIFKMILQHKDFYILIINLLTTSVLANSQSGA